VNILRTAILLFALLFAACANHEGIYEPACIAYEGDRITLQDGGFEWQRFTDQRSVDDDGNIVNPFPEFPKIGTYDIAAGRLELVTSDGARLDDWYVVVRDGHRYLLTSKQHGAIVDGKKMPDCALRLTGSGS
jgi:hypothetical protein